MAELLLDDPKRMLDLGPNACFDALNLVGDGLRRVTQIQRLALARPHGHMPVHTTLGLWALVCTLVARVSKGIGFFTVQQLVRLGHVIDIGSSTLNAVHQTRIGIHTNVVTSIKRVTDLMGEISATSNEQSLGVSQIGEAVTQMTK